MLYEMKKARTGTVVTGGQIGPATAKEQMLPPREKRIHRERHQRAKLRLSMEVFKDEV